MRVQPALQARTTRAAGHVERQPRRGRAMPWGGSSSRSCSSPGGDLREVWRVVMSILKPERLRWVGAMFALALPSTAGAQMLPYISAQSGAAYVPLAGGTNVPFVVTFPPADDQAALVPIGFSF